MSNSESSSEEDQFQDTFGEHNIQQTPSKSVRFLEQQELLDQEKSSPAQNTRSSNKELFQSRLTSSITKMTERKNQVPIFNDPKPLEDPILENPLETFFKPSLTREEMD